mgnify:CR=1 FL=1
MQIKQGAKVITSDNQDVGRVDRVVLDPSTKAEHPGLYPRSAA